MNIQLISSYASSILLAVTTTYLYFENQDIKEKQSVLYDYVVKANAKAADNEEKIAGMLKDGNQTKIQILDISNFKALPEELRSAALNKAMIDAERKSKDEGVITLMPEAVFAFPKNLRAE